MNGKTWNKDTTAFIVGNGTSRITYDLTKLLPYGTMYGCNLLFTESENFQFPHFTVSIEDYRKEMIRESGFPEDRCIFPPEEEQYEAAEYWNNRWPRPRSNAGQNAMIEAIKMGHTTLYMLGFDFIVEGEQSVSNMFSGKKKVRTTYEDTIRRIQYFDWYAQQNPEVRFELVFPPKYTNFRSLQALNVYGCYFETLDARLGI